MYTSPYTAHMLITISILLPILGTLAVALRFWTRRNYKTKIGPEDWLIIPALVLEYAIASLLLWGAFSRSFGYPIPAPNVPGPKGFVYSMSPEQKNFMMIQFIIHPLYAVATLLIKLSILFFYQRIFCNGTSTKLRYIIKASMVALTLWTVAYVFGQIFICGSSVSSRWDTVYVISQKCPQADNFSFGASIASFVSDVIILVMPLPKIWGLHMRTRQKLSVTAVFMIGLLATAASAVRLANWAIIWNGHWTFPDGEYIATTVVTWVIVEVGVGLIAACLLTLSPLIRHISAGRVIRSIRSTLSLTSQRSRSRDEAATPRKPSEDSSVELNSYPKVATVHSDIESGTQVPYTGPNGHITVHTHIQRDGL